jgi:quinol monooxygenase YgiN
MRVHFSKKVFLIQTQRRFSSTFAQLMQDSVAKMKTYDGCIYCQLHAEKPRDGLWIIRCAWNNFDSMLTSVEEIFQPAFETLLFENAVLSIRVCEDDHPEVTLRFAGKGLEAPFYTPLAL